MSHLSARNVSPVEHVRWLGRIEVSIVESQECKSHLCAGC